MRPTKRRSSNVVTGILAVMLLAAIIAPAASAQDETVVNFDEHVQPIMQEYCLGCHRGSRARNGFKAGSLTDILEGGSSGAGLVPGDPEQSLLYQLVARQRQPYMPYEDDPLPAELVETIRAWIAVGAPENAGSDRMEPKPQVAAAMMPITTSEAVAAMPGSTLRRDPYWWSERAGAVTALAAAPQAPLLAVGGHRQVLLYHLESHALLGVLDFPEGSIHALRFSRHGSVLIAGGGRGGASGVVVGWDVATAERLFAIGDEPDAVLAADITNDHRLVAMGGPDRVVRVYLVETGSLLYEIDKHTDWVTSLAFSPDGVLLATGDRTGGLLVWEADTGREFHELPAHRGRVSAVDWRLDSMVLASAGEDGAVRLYEMENGGQIRTWSSHGGVLALSYGADGRIATAGRDRLARVWDGAGQPQQQIGPLADLATAVTLRHDSARVIVGGWAGEVHVHDTADAARVASLAANPPPQLFLALATAEVAVPPREAQVVTLEQQVSEADSTAKIRADAAAAAEQTRAAADGEAVALEQQVAALKATADQAHADAAGVQAVAAGKTAAAEEIGAAFESARAEAARTHDEMLAAVQEAVDAEAALAGAAPEARPAAEARLALAARLLDGATALAREAASAGAALEVEHTRRAVERDRWAALAAPPAETARLAAEKHRQAHDAAVTARAAANAAAAVVQAATSEMTATSEAARELRERLAAAREQLTEAQRLAASTRAAWEAQRAAITAAGGRLPD